MTNYATYEKMHKNSSTIVRKKFGKVGSMELTKAKGIEIINILKDYLEIMTDTKNNPKLVLENNSILDEEQQLKYLIFEQILTCIPMA